MFVFGLKCLSSFIMFKKVALSKVWNDSSFILQHNSKTLFSPKIALYKDDIIWVTVTVTEILMVSNVEIKVTELWN